MKWIKPDVWTLCSLILGCIAMWYTNKQNSKVTREIHMTSNRNKVPVSQLMLAFQLFIAFQTLFLPLTARNIKSSVNKSNQSEILVIMKSGVNVSSIYNSFNEFKKMFGVEFPDDRRIAFKSGEGRFISVACAV